MAEFRVLGPVEAVAEGRRVTVPAAKPRALLAILLLRRNQVVAVAELVDALWGEAPPETATKALQGYVSQLRRELGADRLATQAPGYALRVDEGDLDLERFESLAAEGRRRLADGDPAAASRVLAEALSLWRGPALAEFSEPFAREAGARLEEERLSALEDRVDADLALGRHAALVPELEELVAREPYRERPCAQLMLALYRSGRQADALAVYRRTRERYAEELGLEPGRELQALERAILRQDDELELATRPGPAAAAAPSSGVRKGRGRRWILAVALLAAALAAAAATVALTHERSSPQRTVPANQAAVAAFVVKLENFLAQSGTGRREVASTIDRASRCRLARPATLARLDSVQRNRQSLLQQVAALSVPAGDEPLRASDLLQQAIQASIAADWRYRDWLVAARGCPRRPNRDLRAARAADRQATAAKKQFLRAFNPMARHAGKRTWRAAEL